MHGSDVKFYKYLSPDAATAVLENRTFRWSSPKLFNDPFDLPSEIDFSFEADELAEALLDELAHLVYGDQEPTGDRGNALFALSMLTRRNRNKPEESVFRRDMRHAMTETAVRFKEGQEGLRAFYRSFREQFAVLCVSKIHDDLLMWAHYAADHSGCVFKLRCLPELDRPLCAAQEVSYQSQYPLIANLSDYVKHLTGQVPLDQDGLFKVFAFTKSRHWSYEQEWRCVSLLRDKDAGFDYDPLVPEELEAVYLGCRIEDSVKDKIIVLLTSDFPDASVFQAEPDIQRFALTFAQIR